MRLSRLKVCLIGLLSIGIIGLAVHQAVAWWSIKSLSLKSASLPIKYVRTEGVFLYLSKDETMAILQPLVSTSFFDADMQAIQATVAGLPWVATATVKRIWPDTIAIKVQEKKAYARWNKDSLITEQGVIFSPSNVNLFNDMLQLSGPDKREAKVLEIMKGIKTALADQSMELAGFSISDRWAWKIKLSSGLEILLGRNQPLEKLERFLKTLSVLKQAQVEQMALVDLRYPNGYAVSWKPDLPAIDWKAIESSR